MRNRNAGYRPQKRHMGSAEVTVECGNIALSREKSVGFKKGRRMIFVPRSLLPEGMHDAGKGDFIKKVVMPFYLAAKFGILAKR